jgi:hypothetical protein
MRDPCKCSALQDTRLTATRDLEYPRLQPNGVSATSTGTVRVPRIGIMPKNFTELLKVISNGIICLNPESLCTELSSCWATVTKEDHAPT